MSHNSRKIIFVSHASRDKTKHVRPVVDFLIREGYIVFVDNPRDLGYSADYIQAHSMRFIPNGQDWTAAIRHGLKECDFVLGCFSRALLEERVVLEEEIKFGAIAGKLMACVVDDLNSDQLPSKIGTVPLPAVQAPRVNTSALSRALSHLSQNKPLLENSEEANAFEDMRFIVGSKAQVIVKKSPHGFSGQAPFRFELTNEGSLPYERPSTDVNEKSVWGGLADLAAEPAKKYLQGGFVTDQVWQIANHVAIERQEEEDILDALSANPVTVVTAAAGDGKTTLARRIGLKIRSRSEKRVFFEDDPSKLMSSIHNLQGSDIVVDGVLIIDDAHEIFNWPEFIEFIRDHKSLRVILFAREYPWLLNNFRSDKLRFRHIKLRQLGPDEIEKLACQMVAFRVTAAGLEIDEAKARISGALGDRRLHLLAAVISVAEGKDYFSIVASIKDSFEQSGSGVILQFCVILNFLFDHSQGLSPLPSRYFLEAIFEKYIWKSSVSGSRKRDRTLRERLRTNLEMIESELFRSKTLGRSLSSRYVLRHPKIAEILWEGYYGGEPGIEVQDVDSLSEDVCEIIKLGIEIAHNERKGETLPSNFDAVKIVRALFCQQTLKWIPYHVRGNALEALLSGFGFYSGEVENEARIVSRILRECDTCDKPLVMRLYWNAGGRNSNLLGIWFAFEKESHAGEFHAPEAYSARWIARQYWKGGGRDPNLLGIWFAFEKESHAGEFHAPEEYSARWIARQYWKGGGRDPNLLSIWFAFEKEIHAGEFHAPEEYSARWIARQYWKGGGRDPNLLSVWFAFEKETHAGEFHAPEEYSARWIARQYWEGGGRDSNLLGIWFAFEKESHAGEFHAPEEYSARWIARQYWEGGGRDPNLLSIWFAFEKESYAGEFHAPEEYSARWIARQYWEGGGRDPNALSVWFAFEKDSHGGEFHAPEQYSAQWIARQYWEGDGRDPNALSVWFAFEKETQAGEFHAPEQYSARWIARQYWEGGGRDPNLLSIWFAFEKESHGGEFHAPEEYSARWIARQYWEGDGRDPNALSVWFAFEKETQAGEFHAPEQYSARWIARQYWEGGGRDPNLLSIWFAFEKESHAGEFHVPEEYSARWIARQYWEGGGRDPNLLSIWFAFEKESHGGEFHAPEQYSARWIARQYWEGDGRDPNLLSIWFAFEKESHAGEFHAPEQYSARWIARNAKRTGSELILLELAKLELCSSDGVVGNCFSPETWSAYNLLNNFVPKSIGNAKQRFRLIFDMAPWANEDSDGLSLKALYIQATEKFGENHGSFNDWLAYADEFE